MKKANGADPSGALAGYDSLDKLLEARPAASNII
jgi:hypothetical protein